jgi:hypothetical protein
MRTKLTGHVSFMREMRINAAFLSLILKSLNHLSALVEYRRIALKNCKNVE